MGLGAPNTEAVDVGDRRHPPDRGGNGRHAWPISTALSLWAFGYACYRTYYAAGGTSECLDNPSRPYSSVQSMPSAPP